MGHEHCGLTFCVHISTRDKCTLVTFVQARLPVPPLPPLPASVCVGLSGIQFKLSLLLSLQPAPQQRYLPLTSACNGQGNLPLYIVAPRGHVKVDAWREAA